MPISGRLLAASRNLLQVIHQEFGIASGAVFEYKLKSARSADARNRRRRERKRGSLRKSDQLQVQLRLDHLVLLLDLLSVFPWLQGHTEERVVGGAGRLRRLNPTAVVEYLTPGVFFRTSSTPCCFRRALNGGGFRQLHLDVHVSLVFVGQEAGRHCLHEEARWPHQNLPALPPRGDSCE